MSLRSILIVFTLALSASRGWAQPDSGQLNIDVDTGQVSVSAQNSELSDRQLQALRAHVQRKLAHTPLRERGELHLTLRGEPLHALATQLNTVNLDDARAVSAVIERFVELRFEADHARPLTEPIELVIGRKFAFGPADMPGSIVAIGASGSIDGALSDLIAVGSRVQLGPDAQVTQRLIGVGSQLELAQGARITGQQVELSIPSLSGASPAGWAWSEPAQDRFMSRLAATVIGVLLSLGLGSLLAQLLPGYTDRVLSRLRTAPLPAFGIGLAHYFAIVPGAVLLVISVVGILLLPVYALLLLSLLWAAYVAGAATLGGWLAPTWRGWQRLLLGLSLLSALGFVPVLGWLLGFGAVTSGLGAILLTLYRRDRGGPDRTRPNVPAALEGTNAPDSPPSPQQA